MSNPLPSLPGFALDKALQRMRGRQAMLERLLASFSNSHADSPNDLEQFIQNGDLENAQRLAHQMKGAAANVGAERLSETAATIEMALKNESEPTREDLKAFRQGFLDLSECVRLIQSNQIGNAQYLDKLKELKKYLDFDFAAAVKLIEALEHSELNDDQTKEIAELSALFEQFQIPSMQAFINTLIEKYQDA